ncbi:MAG: FAD-dependent oxidoreductase, partial [Elusimicrobia bacterium]|nr:FAD-dependent oxidoreductase [Elusimicrobiota bacterium]
YIRNEYPLAVKRMLVAMEAAREYGLLGENILGSNFSFDVDLKKGAGAFVCGEETSLMASIEGRPPEPRQRPPYPVELGIWDKPTNINNVETWATVPEIINKGADWFSSIGTETSKGTKVFSLVGKVKNTGLVEVPMGISLKEIVFDIGGGIIGDKKFKAVQTGGPSGGCLPKSLLELPIDYEKLAEAGSIMGSGGMIVMDEDTCMVDVARYFLDFLREESCGKCTSCRDGIEAMYECINDICEGRGKEQDIALLEELASAVKDASQCGLGQTASNPVLSTLRYFRNEYERHIVDKRCDAFVCKKLVGAPCQSACPLGTEAWRYIALLEKGRYKEAYEVIRQTNPFPSVCARVCDHRCETRCRLGTSGGEPVAIRALKRVIADTMGDYAHKPAKPAPGRDIKVAVVGAGPAGLSAAHYLSVNGYTVTVFDAESEAGGMLISSIPAYRLPREAVRKEIKALMNENMTLKCSTLLGRDITIDSLFEQGFKAIFLALGAHESLRLGLEGEDAKGVYPSMRFLKAYNLRNEALARGNVGVIGGGNSAVDAARVALRQKGVESVTILYRRTRQEMPAYKEEIDAALEEGIRLDTLVTPVRVLSENGGLTGIKCIRNNLGDVDSSGRRRPVPIPGSEFDVPLDILIVAISERPEKESVASLGLNSERDGRLRIDPSTFSTSRQGVFAGGDIVTGPSTVVDAIAAGMKTAGVIDRYLQGKELRQPPELKLPDVFIEPVPAEEIKEDAKRAHPRTLSVQSRKGNFAEVEMTFTMAEAVQETRRCLRCDLEFTQQPKEKEQEAVADKAGVAVN